MIKKLPFKEHLQEYESWFDRHPAVYESEIAALHQVWPTGNNLKSLEIGAATGRFSDALKITEALDPESCLLEKAEARGINTMPGRAEDLPYASSQFDIVFIGTSIHYFTDTGKAIKEAYRVLKNSGKLIVAVIDKKSEIGKEYMTRKNDDLFYSMAHFPTVGEMQMEIINAGFIHLEFLQTLFGPLESIQTAQHCKSGYGEGSYVIIKAEKPGYDFPWPR